MNRAYLFVAVTVGLTVYGQMIIKWQTGKAGMFPDHARERLSHLGNFLINPWVISSLLAAFVAALAWIAALSRIDLSSAYPFVAASFVLVLALSAIVFGESMTLPKVAGALLIVLGLIVASQG